MLNVKGTFYPEGTSQSYSCDIHLHVGGLMSFKLPNSDQNKQINRKDLSIKPKLGRIPRELSVSGLGLFSIESDDKVDTWLLGDKQTDTVVKMEGNLPIIFASMLLVPVLLFSIFKYGIPGFAIYFAELVPDPMINITSQHTLIGMDKTLLSPSKLDEQTRLELIEKWQDTLNQLTLRDRNYNLNFRYSKQFGANAFALPDGTVVVTDGLVELVENDWPMLQAILLHEIGHVEHNHSMRLIAELMATSIAINYFFGDLEGMIEVVAGFTSTVMQNQYSQKLEWEADNFAISQLQNLNLDPESFALAMEKLATTGPEHSELDEFFHSHPLTQERIQNARNAAK
jgi:Zn-dependent protease with chaperone function